MEEIKILKTDKGKPTKILYNGMVFIWEPGTEKAYFDSLKGKEEHKRNTARNLAKKGIIRSDV